MGNDRLCQVRLPGAGPVPQPPPASVSYPSTVVKTWHARNALVSLLSFFQECHWVSCLALGTVPANGLRRKRQQCRVWVREGLERPSQHPPTGSGSQPCREPLQQLCSNLRGPNPTTGFELPPGRSTEGPSQSHFADRRVGGGGGPVEGTICPGCACICTHCEDMPPG